MKIEIIELRSGHGSVAIGYGSRTDFEAVEEDVEDFFTAALSAQHLADRHMGDCANGHKHTCAVSIVNDETFGDIIVIVSLLFHLFLLM